MRSKDSFNKKPYKFEHINKKFDAVYPALSNLCLARSRPEPGVTSPMPMLKPRSMRYLEVSLANRHIAVVATLSPQSRSSTQNMLFLPPEPSVDLSIEPTSSSELRMTTTIMRKAEAISPRSTSQFETFNSTIFLFIKHFTGFGFPTFRPQAI